MTDFDDNNQSNQQFSHNVEVALMALKRMCGDSWQQGSSPNSDLDLERYIDYNFQLRLFAANSNRKMSGVLEQITIYMMMQKSPTFKEIYLSQTKKNQYEDTDK